MQESCFGKFNGLFISVNYNLQCTGVLNGSVKKC
jgi:hypothetical protein